MLGLLREEERRGRTLDRHETVTVVTLVTG
jgi:hypothetical protein